MPATTWLREGEGLQPTGHKVVDDTIRELRAVTGKDWRVEKHTQKQRMLCFSRSRDFFTLYVGLGDSLLGSEFQIINFHRDGTDWSINHYVPAELVVAYMFGACVRPSPTTPSQNDG